ncbi:hypothetical protein [Ancylomarina sp. 16SWW S1-10-2]|uniref:hypothetical protein n=1 Tax=Ancylomarina sp. 16SWW S1-10-2 TaxID=2499681 RepID=UPI0012AD73AF|nr:hypothetical protein [Ancylomarina sp. 16SWW S1-10-2]MRT92210.1 hypothetical protein [Ancylomarina sp. 16SWW S1-10-2]
MGKVNRLKRFGGRWLIILTVVITSSCNSSKLKETPIENFIGEWVLQGRSIFEGVVVSIEKNEEGNLSGKVISLNNNKYVKMFVENGDSWVSNISRSSNFEFKLTEKKIGSSLFALYGQQTSKDFKVQFIDENTIGLGEESSDPLKSSITYKRVNK